MFGILDPNAMDLLKGLTVNLFILLGFVMLGVLAGSWFRYRERGGRNILIGLLFGIMTIVAMLVPVTVSHDLIFDCRVAVVGTVALLAGPVAALASLPLPVAYRVYLGGSGMVPGVMEILVPAVLGSLCHIRCRRRSGTITPSCLVGASLITGAGTYILLAFTVSFLVPEATLSLGVFSFLVLLIVSPTAMFILSSLILLEHHHFVAVAAVIESERRMFHSQKMAAIGQLSRKLAHEFINALTAIVGNARLASRHKDDPSMVEEAAEEIEKAGMDISELTGEILAFSSPDDGQRIRIYPKKYLENMRGLLRKTLGSGIRLQIDADAATGQIEVNPDRFEQAIVHLCINAAEAMEGKGNLAIAVGPAKLNGGQKRRIQAGINQSARDKGKYVVISVTDTGCGMSPEVTSRVFEPFFTTKEDSRNAGLGLATVYAIVHQHNGAIEIDTSPGKGSSFKIYLPAAGR